VSKPQLDSFQIAGLAIDEGGFGAPQGVRGIGCRVEPDRGHSSLNGADILPGRAMRRGFEPALEVIFFRARNGSPESAVIDRRVFSVISNCTGLPVFFRMITPRLHVSASGDIPNSQPDQIAAPQLLSIARLNRTRFRASPSSSSGVLIDQTSLICRAGF
jgi:hypothetical protein